MFLYFLNSAAIILFQAEVFLSFCNSEREFLVYSWCF